MIGTFVSVRRYQHIESENLGSLITPRMSTNAKSVIENKLTQEIKLYQKGMQLSAHF